MIAFCRQASIPKKAALIVALILVAIPGEMTASWCGNPVPPCDPTSPLSTCYQPPPPDPRCEPRECKKCTKSPCFVATGVYAYSDTDLTLPTPGFPLVIARKYESSQLIDGPLGFGWTSSLTARLFYTTYLLAAPDIVEREVVITFFDGAHHRYAENADGSFSAPLGRHDSLVRNSDGSFELTMQRSMSKVNFDTEGRVTSVVDDYGNTLQYAYDAVGRLERVSDLSGSGRYVDVLWGADGRIGDLVDSAGRQVGYIYDSRGLLVEVHDPLERVTDYSYAQGRYVPLLSGVADNWGRGITTVTYDAQDRVSSYSDRGESYSYEYSFQNDPLKTRKLDTRGYAWTYVHGSGGLVTEEIAPSSLGTRSVSYSDDGQVLLFIDEVGVKTLRHYDADGRLEWISRSYQAPDEIRFQYSYHPVFRNRVTEITPIDPTTGQRHPHWQGRRFTYVPPGAVAAGARHEVFAVAADGSSEIRERSFEYNAQGRVTAEMDAAGARTEYVFNAAGDLILVRRPLNSDAGSRPEVQYEVDSLGRVTKVVSPDGAEWQYEYDLLGRITRTTPPLPSPTSDADLTVEYEYDEFDSVSQLLFDTSLGPGLLEGRIGRDQFGRQIELWVSGDLIRRNAFSRGLLDSTIDGNGNETHLEYDARRRLISLIWPDGQEETYSYWEDGLLKSKVDRKGQTSSFTYDRQKRLLSRSTAQGAVTFDYLGQKLVGIQDGTASPAEVTAFQFDSNFRRTQVEQGERGTISYVYNDLGLQTGSFIQGGPTTAYTYYPDQSVRSIEWSPVAGLFEFTYNLNGEQIGVRAPSGQTRSFEYDDLGRVTSVKNRASDLSTLASFDYYYDGGSGAGEATKLGLRTGAQVTVPALALAGFEIAYDYDYQGRLRRVSYPAGAPLYARIDEWAYDLIGNRVSSTRNGQTNSLTYGKVGQNPLNWQRLENDGERSYTYDTNGNVTSIIEGGVARSFLWSAEDRLVGVQGTESLSFRYDYFGRRTTRAEGSEVTSFLYDSREPVAQYASSERYFLFGPGLAEPLATAGTEGLSYFATDGVNGSVVLTANSLGSVVHASLFDPWGEVVLEQGIRPHRFGYGSREDEAGGLVFMRNRYYSPEIGRFLQEDRYALPNPSWIRSEYRALLNTFPVPLGMFAKESAVGSRLENPVAGIDDVSYYFGDNNPVSMVDPEGTTGVPPYTPFKWIPISFIECSLKGRDCHQEWHKWCACNMPASDMNECHWNVSYVCNAQYLRCITKIKWIWGYFFDDEIGPEDVMPGASPFP